MNQLADTINEVIQHMGADPQVAVAAADIAIAFFTIAMEKAQGDFDFAVWAAKQDAE